jgi:predicted nucleotidyltransferase
MISELQKILSIRNLVDKKAYFMSLLTRETELKNVKPIVVGGSAVDFYTNGVFQSNDIDLVGSRKIIGDVLENTFGFKRSGRHWIDEQIGIFIEVPGDYLAGSKDKITTMTVEGLKLYIIGIEDLIIDRMAACQEWKSETDCRQAHYLLRYYQSRIDFEYISEKAKQEGLLAVLKKFSRTSNSK